MDTKFTMFLRKLVLVIISMSLFNISPAHAGVTGKVAGFVRDNETGDPLPMANIVIEGTTRGAASDLDGYYFIINVPPGKYVLKATMMGYQTTAANITVMVDLTTTYDFNFIPTVVDLGETVIVTAERPLIQPEITHSRTTVTGEMIQNMPVNTVQEVKIR